MRKKINLCFLRIICLYTIIPFLIVAILYPLLPKILNYPNGSIDNQFQINLDGLTYTQQYLLLIFLILFFSLIILFIRAYRMYKLISKLNTNKLSEDETISTLYKIRAFCYNTPYLLYFLEILVPLIFLPLTFSILNAYSITILKICLVYISFFTLASVITFIFAKNEFGYILNLLSSMYPKLMEEIELVNSNNKKRKIKSLPIKLILEILPLVLVTLIFLTLASYEQLTKEIGDVYYNAYYSLFSNNFNKQFSSKEDLKTDLLGLPLLDKSHKYFIISENGDYFTSDNGSLNKFFVEYTLQKSDSQNGHTYDYYCLDNEGTSFKCYLTDGSLYYVGIYYNISQPNFSKFILTCDIVLCFIIFMILIYISFSLSKEIKTVSTKLKKIASSNRTDINLDDTLTITSEDELADLSLSFNLIQSFTKNNVDELKSNQSTLMEQERLASLGQLIGGIAHNLKTPIMSISGAAEGLNDLITEYDTSIDDPEVTSLDHHDIAKDMYSWVSKIKTHTEYMSDVITAVKGQAVNLSNEQDISFTVEELIKRVNILMKHELKTAIIYLNIKMLANEDITINGDVNSLVQVINNMISNSIQAYNGKTEQNIDLIIEHKQNNLIISVKDYGSGIPEKVKDKLFKEMITTKGKNGTGLGLYMSYSTIKAHFNGDIQIESEEGKGTTFSIILPLN